MALALNGTGQSTNGINGATVTISFANCLPNDIIVVAGIHGAAVTTLTTPAYTAGAGSAFSALATHSGSAPVCGAWWSRVSSTGTCTVNFVGGGSASDAVAFVGYCIRGGNIGTQPDATATTAGPTTSTNPNPPSLTTVTDGAMALAFEFHLAATSSSAAPTNYSNLIANNRSDTNPVGCAGATRIIASHAAEDPGTFTNASNVSWFTITAALRPVVSQTLSTAAGTVNANEAVVASSVKPSSGVESSSATTVASSNKASAGTISASAVAVPSSPPSVTTGGGTESAAASLKASSVKAASGAESGAVALKASSVKAATGGEAGHAATKASSVKAVTGAESATATLKASSVKAAAGNESASAAKVASSVKAASGAESATASKVASSVKAGTGSASATAAKVASSVVHASGTMAASSAQNGFSGGQTPGSSNESASASVVASSVKAASAGQAATSAGLASSVYPALATASASAIVVPHNPGEEPPPPPPPAEVQSSTGGGSAGFVGNYFFRNRAALKRATERLKAKFKRPTLPVAEPAPETAPAKVYGTLQSIARKADLGKLSGNARLVGVAKSIDGRAKRVHKADGYKLTVGHAATLTRRRAMSGMTGKVDTSKTDMEIALAVILAEELEDEEIA